MKIVRGKIKLDERDKRFGNFVIQLEPNFVKVCDISQLFTYRVRRTIAAGKFLEAIYNEFDEEGMQNTLKNYIAVLWSCFATVPDGIFLETVYKAAKECIERHPDVYGVPKLEHTEEEDAAALKTQEELHELEEAVKKTAKKPRKKKSDAEA